MEVMYETAEGPYTAPERKVGLVHRVIVPDKDYPKEYAILVTDRRSIFIRQKKTRGSFVLRGEMRYGTALVTDVQPKTLEDYEQTTLESLAADASNIAVSHNAVISLVMTKGEPKFRLREFFVWLTMRRQGHKFHVYDLEMNYRDGVKQEMKLQFYIVPLGAYFKPRRQTQTRETILREYAVDALQIFQKVLPDRVISW
ncbi:MAG: hypothetical protein AUF79_18045 [Crenarchaeota archaeon 13_1_20CM_2_51_8]|nr:MAG: hypothetical protein AUF79_18045 [Crenarchaeota archaeon 13_1_20CM_2_51_8]